MNCMPEFPAALPDFLACQERLAGRSLTENEREVSAAFLEVFNDVADGKLDAQAVLQKLDQYAEDSAPQLAQFLAAARNWVLAANAQRQARG